MKRFLLFGGLEYDAPGGWHDFSGSFNTMDEALAVLTEIRLVRPIDWAHVVDAEKGEIVHEWEKPIDPVQARKLAARQGEIA